MLEACATPAIAIERASRIRMPGMKTTTGAVRQLFAVAAAAFTLLASSPAHPADAGKAAPSRSANEAAAQQPAAVAPAIDEARPNKVEGTAKKVRKLRWIALLVATVAAGFAFAAWWMARRRALAREIGATPLDAWIATLDRAFSSADDLGRRTTSRLVIGAVSVSMLAAIALAWIASRVPQADPGRRATLGLVALVAVGAAAGGWLALLARGLRASVRKPSAIGATQYVAISAAILLWFRWADVWNTQFAAPGLAYLGYNAARLVFALFLSVALVGAGRTVLRPAEAPPGSHYSVLLATAVSCFFTGAAAWIVGLFVLGLCGGLYWWLLLAIAAACAWRGYAVVAGLGSAMRSAVAQSAQLRSAYGALWLGALAAALAATWGLVLLNSGLAVSGFEYDSSGHYLPYYQAVVENHGIGPNELWYHFWVSKGAGLHFLSVLLTDVQGPQLVSLVFSVAAAVAMFALVREAGGSSIWGLGAAAILSAAFVSEFVYFQKHHLVTLGLVAGLLWSARPEDRGATGARLAGRALLAAAAVMHTPPIGAVVLPYLGVLALLEWRQQHAAGARLSVAPGLPAAAALAALCFMIGLNYLWAGLGEVTPFKLFFDHADQERLARYASPYLILMAQEGSGDATGKLSLAALASPELFVLRIRDLLRLQALAPRVLVLLALAAFAWIAAAIAWRAWRAALLRSFGPALALLAVATAVGFFVNQPGSIERFYTFAFFPVVQLALGAPALMLRLAGDALPPARARALGLAGVAAVALAGVASDARWLTRWLGLNGRGFLAERAAFAGGQRTFEQALTYAHYRRDQKDWPRRDLSEECLGVRGALAAEAAKSPQPPRVWTISFLQESGCHILPGVRIQMEFSVAFGNRWHAIVFGPAEAAQKELERIGVRYVYVNLADFDIKELSAISTSVFGCLAYSPLFEPARLQKQARIVWRKGQSYLLALDPAAPGTAPDARFIEAWRHKVFAVQHGLGDMPGLCARLKHYHDAQQERWPVRADESLPRVKGWQ